MKTDYTILLQNEDTIAWKTCIEKEDEFHQNIEFKGKDWNKKFYRRIISNYFESIAIR